MKWEKTGKTVYANGESKITYSTQSSDITIESRKKVVPHANGIGSWFYTHYFVVDGNGADVKECIRLTEAKDAAENLIRTEDSNDK